MSRVHEALRRAEQLAAQSGESAPQQETPPAVVATAVAEPEPSPAAYVPPAPPPERHEVYSPEPAWGANGSSEIRRSSKTLVAPGGILADLDLSNLLASVRNVPFAPPPDVHLIDSGRPHEAPSEEFRTLRTRLNHLQSVQPIHSIVVTSPSPAEGKSMVAVNLALAEAQLAHNDTLIADFDFRRPMLHQMFQIERSPGITDFLLGKASLEQIVKKVEGTNLYAMPAGEAVLNPLELLNLPAVKTLLNTLPKLFNWVIVDSPPLLFAADAALLGTMCDGSVLVVRMGHTTIDSVTRAIGSLCENNVLGIVVNGARKGELYSKYTYYHSYYYSKQD